MVKLKEKVRKRREVLRSGLIRAKVKDSLQDKASMEVEDNESQDPESEAIPENEEKSQSGSQQQESTKKKNESILRVGKLSAITSDEEPDEASMEGEESKIQDLEDEEQPSSSSKQQDSAKVKKIRKKGIVFIGNIPKHMNVALCRELMEQFGEVGRIFLQPETDVLTKKSSKKKKNVTFKEGWVEFEKKKVAKFVAQHINNTPISTKKGSIFCDMLWTLKYLPGFKWIHLSERLTYERAVRHQRKQMAIGKARKEANFFQNNLDRSEKFEKKKKKLKPQE